MIINLIPIIMILLITSLLQTGLVNEEYIDKLLTYVVSTVVTAALLVVLFILSVIIVLIN